MNSRHTQRWSGEGARSLLASGPLWAEEPTPPELGGRYQLGHRLGQGAFGAVWAAVDACTGAPVAIKRVPLPDAEARRRVRREVAALRALQIPGVVRLFDEGEDDQGAWIAMERVDGAPFPGAGDWRPAAQALVRTLWWVHRAGLLHRDLKPDNVLVTAAGQVVVLDFGVVEGIELGRPARGGAGSPLWMSPEQLDAAPIDAASDLYAIGVMIYEALAGRPPWLAHDLAQLRAEKMQPVGLPAETPPALRPLLGALLDPDPRARPSARALLAALDEDAPAPIPSGPDRFCGPQRLLRLPARAEAALQALAGPDPEAQAAELADWRRLGLVEAQAGRLRPCLPLLSALERSLPASQRGGAIARLLVAGADEERILSEGLAMAEAHLDAGEPAAAIATLEALRAFARDPAARAALFRPWAQAALSTGHPSHIEPLLFELGRAEVLGRAGLERLLGAALRLARGAPLDEDALTEPFLEEPDQGLEVWRMALRCRAAARAGRLDEALEAARAWATDRPARAAACWGWQGNRLYAQERYAEAAEAHRRAALGKASRSARLASRLNEATARAELGLLDEAEALARAAAAEAEALDHLGHGLRAALLLRTIEARRGVGTPYDPDLHEVAANLGDPALRGPLLTAEAALAWRAGLPAAGLARAAAEAFRAARSPQGATLLDAFAAALDRDRPQMEALLPALYALQSPGIAVQALRLAATLLDRPALRLRQQAVWRALPPGPPDQALELLLRSECDISAPALTGF